MSSKPDFARQPVSPSLAPDVENLAPSTEGKDSPGSNDLSLQNSSYDKHYILLLLAIFIMLAWPWIFFGVVWHSKGLLMNTYVAKLVQNNPQSANFFVTFIANIICLSVGFLFSTAVIRFAQKWVIDNKTQDNRITVFHVSLFSAIRYRNFPWRIHELRSLLVRKRWLFALLVVFCIGTFAFILSATTSLVSPVTFYTPVALEGTEINFASNAPDCVDWFNANRISATCDSQRFKSFQYSTCITPTEVPDSLESGRNNVRSLLSNDSQRAIFSTLNGLRFLGPLRGVVPNGPDGIPAFNTLTSFPLSELETDPNAGSISAPFNYTLKLQGLISEIKCVYDVESPVRFLVTGDTLLYTGTCPSGGDILTDTFAPPNSNSSLGFWACDTSSGGSKQYNLYLSGRALYESAIGNITCTVSSIQPAIFPVTYQSRFNSFSTLNSTAASTTNTSSDLIQRAIRGLATVVYLSQSKEFNQMAESVISLGLNSYGLPLYNQSEGFLHLYEAMLQGIIEYEATYTRLIYSTFTTLPLSCVRAVSGFATAKLPGWFVTGANIGFLVPITLVNLASLILTLLAMFMGKKVLYKFDPTDPRSLIFASGKAPGTAGGTTEGWDCQVNFNEGTDSSGQPLADSHVFTVGR